MRILAVDPGGTTGWILWSNENGNSVFANPCIDAWGECDRENFYEVLDDMSSTDLAVIVCERYTITGNTLKKSRQYDALELIGMLRHESWVRGIPFVLQAQNPKFSTNARLKACGLYVKGDHGRSAARQLLLYLVKNDIDPGASPEELRDAVS